jgi:hypothetical protein
MAGLHLSAWVRGALQIISCRSCRSCPTCWSNPRWRPTPLSNGHALAPRHLPPANPQHPQQAAHGFPLPLAGAAGGARQPAGPSGCANCWPSAASGGRHHAAWAPFPIPRPLSVCVQLAAVANWAGASGQGRNALMAEGVVATLLHIMGDTESTVSSTHSTNRKTSRNSGESSRQSDEPGKEASWLLCGLVADRRSSASLPQPSATSSAGRGSRWRPCRPAMRYGARRAIGAVLGWRANAAPRARWGRWSPASRNGCRAFSTTTR